MIWKTTFAAMVAASLLPAATLAQTNVLTPAPKEAENNSVQTVLSHMPKDIVDCQPHDGARETADAKLAQNAWSLLSKHDVAALRALQPKLEEAASHAPDKPSSPEKCNGTLFIYSDNMMDALLAGGMVGNKELGIKSVVQRPPLPYARIDFLLGWLNVEAGQLDKADEWFARGLRNNPRDALLASEHANALSQLGRSEEALAFVESFLADNDDLPEKVRALMLRRKGYALGELRRHDEAVAAYEDSLKYDPDSSVAKSELDWNKSQKKP